MRTEPTQREQIFGFIAAAIAFVIMVTPVWVEAATPSRAPWMEPQGLATTVEQRALEQAEEYRKVVDGLHDQLTRTRERLTTMSDITRGLIEKKAEVDGELAAERARSIELRAKLREVESSRAFSRFVMVFMAITIIALTWIVIYQRRQDKTKPDVPFFSSWFNKSESSWFKRDLVVKPTIKEDK